VAGEETNDTTWWKKDGQHSGEAKVVNLIG
jgi:hypothetical protein